MQQFDANLLFALDELLEAGSVTGAAERLNVSVPAMSRTLLRIRKLMKDPIMVQAGRGLVPTPRALELRDRLHAVVQEARMLTSAPGAALAEVKRTFTIRTEESYIGVFASTVATLVHKKAPQVSVRFIAQGEESIVPLREGLIDLDIGVIKLRGPEVKVQRLFTSKFVGVIRSGHPLSRTKVTASRFVDFEHVSASRRGLAWGPIDEGLKKLGLERRVSLMVPTFFSAMMIAATSDFVAAMPDYLTRLAVSLYGLRIFPLPVPTPTNRISLAWHPRFEVDPVHRFVRECVVEACPRQSHLRGDSE